MVEISASAVARRAASRSCSACLLAVMSRRIQMLCRCGATSARPCVVGAQKSLRLPIASQRFSDLRRNADLAVERIMRSLGRALQNQSWLTRERSRRLSIVAFPSSSRRRPSGLIMTIAPGVVQHQHAARHRIDHLLQRRAHAVVLCQAAGQSRVALGEFRTEMRRPRSADRDRKTRAPTRRR